MKSENYFGGMSPMEIEYIARVAARNARQEEERMHHKAIVKKCKEKYKGKEINVIDNILRHGEAIATAFANVSESSNPIYDDCKGTFCIVRENSETSARYIAMFMLDGSTDTARVSVASSSPEEDLKDMLKAIKRFGGDDGYLWKNVKLASGVISGKLEWKTKTAAINYIADATKFISLLGDKLL